ncbi:MAG TPA: hypothetical protein PK176_15260 [Acidobacteriota bacterium]|nr:hypothetical protein [Acidobacteriota bacterium]HQM64669.1 hypothetical protein [Acidobacteriota bacterium]
MSAVVEAAWIRNIEVSAYSGYRVDERPTAVAWDGSTHAVVEILDRWYGVGYLYFKVRLANGARLLLRHDEWDRQWDGAPLESAGSPTAVPE